MVWLQHPDSSVLSAALLCEFDHPVLPQSWNCHVLRLIWSRQRAARTSCLKAAGCHRSRRLFYRLCGLLWNPNSAPPWLFPTTNPTPGSAVKDLVTSARRAGTELPRQREPPDEWMLSGRINSLIKDTYVHILIFLYLAFSIGFSKSAYKHILVTCCIKIIHLNCVPEQK